MSIFSWKKWRKTLFSSSSSNSVRRVADRRRLRSHRPELEQLEQRLVLDSSVPDLHVTYIVYHPADRPYQSSGPTGYTPDQIRTAYGINKLYPTVGDGAGQTIAIVDAYDNPAFVDSTDPTFLTSDLHMFDKQFGIPDPPSFLKLNQNGGTSLPGQDPNKGWEGEEALDVEWAHALAPGANIILFEANSPSPSDLYTAVSTAAHYKGVTVVSMSFGGDESSAEFNTYDSVFQTPAGHPGVTFLASSGDTGSYDSSGAVVVNYPAASPRVIGVGGTNLQLNPDNTYKSETAWGSGSSSGTNGGSGGGISQFVPEPAYQKGVQSTGFRTVPDVAFDADPASGVAVYDSYTNGSSTPWETVGGTSLASPSWAALIAIADQGLAKNGLPSLDGPTQTLPELYNLYAKKPSDFHDITSGSNGAFSAGPGYDEVTGMGTPVADHLIPDLIGLPVHAILNSAVEGIPLNNVAVATFVDPTGSQPVRNYNARISWGDGIVTNGTVVSNGGANYTVLGSHTYADPGTYALSVTVQNTAFELTGASQSIVTVSDAPLNGFAQALNGTTAQFVTNALVAVFTDTDTTPRLASHYTATVYWNEGNGLVFSSTGSIAQFSGNTFTVYGSSPYTFPSGGLFPVNVVITDLDGGESVTVHSVINVAHNSSVPPLVLQYQSDYGPINGQFASLQDALTNLLSAERLFIFAIAFSKSTQEKLGTFGNLLNALHAYQSAIFAYDMHLPGA